MPLPALAAIPFLSGATAGGAVAGGAGGAGIAGILGGLLTDPVWGALAAELGTGAINKFLGFGGASPEEQANKQRLDAATSAIPDLRRAAAGLPTASSNALMRQVRREGTAFQQSAAASARGAGQLGGTPQGGSIFRAQSERIQGAETEALAQRLGQHQMQAQQLLLGQLQPAIATGSQFARQDLDDEGIVKGALGRLGRKFAENPNDDVVNRFIDVLSKLGLSDASGGGGSTINTPTPGLPSLSAPGSIRNQFKIGVGGR